MALLYGDNFQSYAAGTNPPYGSLVYFSGVTPIVIFADPAGLFGQSKSLFIPPNNFLALPDPIYDGTGAFYQQCSIYQYIKLNNTTDERGAIFTFSNAHGGTNEAISGIRILSDGTLGIVGTFSSAFSPNSAVSDYSLLCNKWYLIRVDISFGSNAGFVEVLSCKVYINGVVVVQVSNIVTGIVLAHFTHLYFNNILFCGSGNGLNLGGLWVYDTIQSDTFFPNPGTPFARLNQGVIELIKKRAVRTGGNNTRIYEA